MSAAALFLPGEGSFHTPHSERLNSLPHDLRIAATEVWHAVVNKLPRGKTETDERLTDRALAKLLGRSRRFVQKGLKALQDLGMIKRCRQWGRRFIIVLERLRGRKKPQPKAGTDAKPSGPRPSPARSSSIPNVGTVRPTTPEHVAAAQAAIAAALAEPPELTPEEKAAADRIWEESRQRREAASRPKLRPTLVNGPRPADTDTAGMTAQALLEAKRRAMSVRIAPDLDPDPATGSPPRPAGP
jgi:hypothetical protein